jgi:aminocarboxymuconate-semialdehyde decarboxylase
VRDLFSPEKEPFLRFTTPETQEINQRLFATVAPKLTSPEERLKDMDSMGIDIQVISPSPTQYYYWTDGELGSQLARIQNDRVAEIVRAYPTRFVGMGTVPLQDVDRAVQELERMVKELGLRAVEISSNMNGVDFDDPRFGKFFAKVEELDALIFMHPIGFTDGGRLREYYLTNVIGQPLESTVAVSRLILSGVLESYPNLKLCVAHGGGYLPYYAGRMDHAYKVRPECQRSLSRPPSTYLRQLYYDTVVYTGETLASLVRQVGSEHVLLGTDYPFDMGETDPVGHIGGVRSLSRADKERLWGGNAARLLKISQ